MWTGKSNLLNVLSGNMFNEYYNKTIGVDHKKKTHNKVILNLWDLSGDPKYENLVHRYFTNSDIILLVYNCSDILDSLGYIKKFYYNNNNIIENKKLILVGNKYDLYNSKNIYNLYEFCKETNIKNFYVSCKTKYGIKNLINFISENYLEKIIEDEHEEILQYYHKFSINNKYNCCNLL